MGPGSIEIVMWNGGTTSIEDGTGLWLCWIEVHSSGVMRYSCSYKSTSCLRKGWGLVEGIMGIEDYVS